MPRMVPRGINLSDEDVEDIDTYLHEHCPISRSAAIQLLIFILTFNAKREEELEKEAFTGIRKQILLDLENNSRRLLDITGR